MDVAQRQSSGLQNRQSGVRVSSSMRSHGYPDDARVAMVMRCSNPAHIIKCWYG